MQQCYAMSHHMKNSNYGNVAMIINGKTGYISFPSPPFPWVFQLLKDHQVIFSPSNCFMKIANMGINWIYRTFKRKQWTLLISVHIANDTYFLVLNQMVNEGSDLNNSQHNYLLYFHWNWNFIENNFVSQFIYGEKCFLPFELQDYWAEYNG